MIRVLLPIQYQFDAIHNQEFSKKGPDLTQTAPLTPELDHDCERN